MDTKDSDFWGKLALHFEERQTSITGNEINETIKGKIMEEKALGNLLEVGCGTCFFTKAVLGEALSVTATDCSESMIKEAEKNSINLERLKIEKANCLDLHYHDRSFDSALMANILHVLDEQEKALSEIGRVLVPGGRLILASFTTEGMSSEELQGMIDRYLKFFGPPPKSRTPLTLDGAIRLLEKNNFKIKRKELIKTQYSRAIYVVANKIN